MSDTPIYDQTRDERGDVGRGPKYPRIIVQLTGEDGNGFFIIGRVNRLMARAGVSAAEQEEFAREAMSGDYNHLLQTAMRWVSVK